MSFPLQTVYDCVLLGSNLFFIIFEVSDNKTED